MKVDYHNVLQFEKKEKFKRIEIKIIQGNIKRIEISDK